MRPCFPSRPPRPGSEKPSHSNTLPRSAQSAPLDTARFHVISSSCRRPLPLLAGRDMRVCARRACWHGIEYVSSTACHVSGTGYKFISRIPRRSTCIANGEPLYLRCVTVSPGSSAAAMRPTASRAPPDAPSRRGYLPSSVAASGVETELHRLNSPCYSTVGLGARRTGSLSGIDVRVWGEYRTSPDSHGRAAAPHQEKRLGRLVQPWGAQYRQSVSDTIRGVRGFGVQSILGSYTHSLSLSPPRAYIRHTSPHNGPHSTTTPRLLCPTHRRGPVQATESGPLPPVWPTPTDVGHTGKVPSRARATRTAKQRTTPCTYPYPQPSRACAHTTPDSSQAVRALFAPAQQAPRSAPWTHTRTPGGVALLYARIMR
ncbi:hypothetical protein BC628DRAFT_662271 [Trametes gibbosa]|nr:hypothetical protein BC628DRAFT_662271 [Trametes gibbosa]